MSTTNRIDNKKPAPNKRPNEVPALASLLNDEEAMPPPPPKKRGRRVGVAVKPFALPIADESQSLLKQVVNEDAPENETPEQRRLRMSRFNDRKKRARRSMKVDFLNRRYHDLTKANQKLRSENSQLREKIATIRRGSGLGEGKEANREEAVASRPAGAEADHHSALMTSAANRSRLDAIVMGALNSLPTPRASSPPSGNQSDAPGREEEEKEEEEKEAKSDKVARPGQQRHEQQSGNHVPDGRKSLPATRPSPPQPGNRVLGVRRSSDRAARPPDPEPGIQNTASNRREEAKASDRGPETRVGAEERGLSSSLGDQGPPQDQGQALIGALQQVRAALQPAQPQRPIIPATVEPQQQAYGANGAAFPVVNPARQHNSSTTTATTTTTTTTSSNSNAQLANIMSSLIQRRQGQDLPAALAQLHQNHQQQQRQPATLACLLQQNQGGSGSGGNILSLLQPENQGTNRSPDVLQLLLQQQQQQAQQPQVATLLTALLSQQQQPGNNEFSTGGGGHVLLSDQPWQPSPLPIAPPQQYQLQQPHQHQQQQRGSNNQDLAAALLQVVHQHQQQQQQQQQQQRQDLAAAVLRVVANGWNQSLSDAVQQILR